MNENEAISKARKFLEDGKHAPVHWDKVRAILSTADKMRAALQKENFGSRDAEVKAFILESERRSHWAVDFPLAIPEGEVWSPDSICVRVDDDTGECEIVRRL